MKTTKTTQSSTANPNSGVDSFIKKSNVNIIDQPKPYNKNYSEDVKQNRIAAVSNPAVKNPLSFTDPTDRQAATLARIQHIMSTPEYKSLSPERQEHLRGRYYDRFVVPAYQKGGFTAPDRNLWVDRITKSGYSPKDFYLDHYTNQAVDRWAGTQRAAGEIFSGLMHAGISYSKAESNVWLGLSNFFFNRITDDPAVQVAHEAGVENQQTAIERLGDKINAISDDTMNSATFWMQTHPSKSFQSKMDSLEGDALITLPLYTTIGAAREAGLGAVEGAGKVENLTKWLNTSKGGQFAAKRLGEAFDGFIGSTLQGQGTKEKIENIASFMGLGSGTEALKVASAPLIKKFIANTAFVGGRPLQQAAFDEAKHELENGLIAGEPHGLQEWTPEAQQKLEKALADDPVKQKLVTGNKVVLNSLSNSNFGKSYSKLNKSQKASIDALHRDIFEQAIDEAPVHMADVAQQNAEAQIQQQAHLDPGYAANVAAFEKQFGIRVADSVVEAEQEAVKTQSGIKSSQGATAKTAKTTAVLERKKAIATKQAQEEDPKKYVALESKAVAYFKNPASSKSTSKAFNIMSSDLKYMDSDEFIKEVRDNLGNPWFFEDNEHMMKWASQFSHAMPPAFKKRFFEELQDLDPNGTKATWAVESYNMSTHLKNMATTGRLSKEGNIFRSSDFRKPPAQSSSKWTRKLNAEAAVIEQKQLGAKLAPMARNYPDQVKTGQNILTQLQESLKQTKKKVQ